MSEDSTIRILFRGSAFRVCLVVLNQGFCSSGQYNLPHRVLSRDVNTTLNQIYVLLITLVNIHIRVAINVSHLSISGIVTHSWCYMSHCFLFFYFFSAAVSNCLLCSAYILQTRNKPNQFLF